MSTNILNSCLIQSIFAESQKITVPDNRSYFAFRTSIRQRTCRIRKNFISPIQFQIAEEVWTLDTKN